MKIFNDIKSIRSFLSQLPQNQISKTKIGFVPTMGALHQGHLSLIKMAKETCNIVVVSIFVNQKQFDNPEDYAKYPKNLQQDISLLKSCGVDALFNPLSDEMYSSNFKTKIIIDDLTENLCGKNRPGHFNGMALIVSKLFNIINPTHAFFGEKDFQQLQIIKRLVSDLNFDIEIIAGETLREYDGLAMSSRNLRLNYESRIIAAKLYENLNLAKEKILLGKDNVDLILQDTTENLLRLGFEKIDYLQICDEENLKPSTIFNPQIKSRLFVAAFIGGIRLIDNIKL